MTSQIPLLRGAFLFLTLVLLVLPLVLDAQLFKTMRPEIRGKRGIVAAGRHYTVEAGMRIFYAGGNAVDAGVASVLAAAVCEISHFGFGGEAPIIIYAPRGEGEPVVISGQGPAPKAASPQLFKDKDQIPGNGPLGATVPAVMDAVAIALEHYGTMSLAEVMQPAIELADGFPLYSFLHRYMVSTREATEAYPSSMAAYYPGGKIPEVGEVFRQPDLARTLRAIVAAEKKALEGGASREKAIIAGRDSFYKGDIARRIADAVQKDGGIMTYQDLAAYQGRIEKPASSTFHGYTIHKCGAWNQGPVLLQALNLLEGFDLKEMGHGSTRYIHTVAEAIKLAYDDRDAYYGDPDFVSVPLQGLLSKEYARERRNLIDRVRAFEGHRPGDPFRFDPEVQSPAARHRLQPNPLSSTQEQGDTTCVNAVDANGMLFSATPSSGWLLGGAYVAGDTGVPMSNRMQAFVLDPASPNVLQGGKRPRTTLTPTLVMKDGKPFLAISTPGGDSQDQQILNVLLSLLVFDMGLQESVEAPRINSRHMFSSFGAHEEDPLALEVESRIAPGVIEALKAKGHKVLLRGPYGISTGITAVGVDPAAGTLRGAADVRRERYVAGW
jgi:gamma-glutamyltranspeptidase/glutathione hydrolase